MIPTHKNNFFMMVGDQSNILTKYIDTETKSDKDEQA